MLIIQVFFFPNSIGILNNCQGDTIQEKINLSTNSILPIKVFGINGKFPNGRISIHNVDIKITDTFFISNKKPLKFKVSFFNRKSLDSSQLKLFFNTNHPNYEKNSVQFSLMTYKLSLKQIQYGEVIEIDKEENCLDSFFLEVPNCGTTTNYSFYEISKKSEFSNDAKMSFRFKCCNSNVISIKSNDTGTYRVSSSCDFNDFTFRIK